MSIAPQLDRYLSVRRSLGYDLRTEERRLCRFARFADQEGAPHIDTALFLRWDASLPAVTTSTRAARLSAVRLFAQWLSSFDPAHEVPPRGLLPDRSQRPRPHIYSEAEITSIIVAAKALPSIYGLRGLTCSTLFGLIAVNGLRIRGACARPWRPRRRERRAARPAGEARQGTAASARPNGGGAARRLCRRARPVARECPRCVLRHLQGNKADRLQRAV